MDLGLGIGLGLVNLGHIEPIKIFYPQNHLKKHEKLDLESIGSSLGIDCELIWSGVEWNGPAIRPGLDNRHLFNRQANRPIL